MQQIKYKEAELSHIPAMAKIRVAEWGTEEYWINRISGYINCELHPQHALLPRVIYVAVKDDELIGYIAGHLSRRYEFDGELEWINVAAEHRGSGVAFELFHMLAEWFVLQGAKKICVDVDPENLVARNFYIKNGAEYLNAHWLFWKDINASLNK